MARWTRSRRGDYLAADLQWPGLPMPPLGAPLDDLRKEIDRLDDALLDGLLERVAVVRRISLVKNDRVAGRIALRPAREAQILRRLVARADGRLPAPTIIAMWRELLAATTHLQTGFTVAVVDGGGPALREVARDQFGSLTPLRTATTPAAACRAVTDGAAQLAVLPMPQSDERWWRDLRWRGVDDDLVVIGRLPFCPRPGAAVSAGLLLGQVTPEPSGDDLTLLRIEAAPEAGDGELGRALQALQARRLAESQASHGQMVQLLELDGFRSDQDARLLAALGRGHLHIEPLGSYPRPLGFTGA